MKKYKKNMVTAGLFCAITFLLAAPASAEYCPPQCRGEWTHVPGETVGDSIISQKSASPHLALTLLVSTGVIG